MLIIISNYKKFSNKIILIQLKLNFKEKSHFKILLSQLHIQLHPILLNTFMTKIITNVQLSYSQAYTYKVLKKHFYALWTLSVEK